MFAIEDEHEDGVDQCEEYPEIDTHKGQRMVGLEVKEVLKKFYHCDGVILLR